MSRPLWVISHHVKGPLFSLQPSQTLSVRPAQPAWSLQPERLIPCHPQSPRVCAASYMDGIFISPLNYFSKLPGVMDCPLFIPYLPRQYVFYLFSRVVRVAGNKVCDFSGQTESGTQLCLGVSLAPSGAGPQECARSETLDAQRGHFPLAVIAFLCDPPIPYFPRPCQ